MRMCKEFHLFGAETSVVRPTGGGGVVGGVS